MTVMTTCELAWHALAVSCPVRETTHVLLDREWARVERDAEDLDARDSARPRAPDVKREQLRDERPDGDGRVAEKQELVQAPAIIPSARVRARGALKGERERAP
jgi:hypothetical protein